MRFSTILVFASLALTGFAVPNARRTVAQIEADIVKISIDLIALIDAIAAFSTNPSIITALTIHTDAVTLGTDINTCTADVKATPTPISEADGQAILTAIQNLEFKIITALNNIIAQKGHIANLPIGGIPALICQDVKSLSTDTIGLEVALIASAPADLKAQANSIEATIDAAFANAIGVLC